MWMNSSAWLPSKTRKQTNNVCQCWKHILEWVSTFGSIHWNPSHLTAVNWHIWECLEEGDDMLQGSCICYRREIMAESCYRPLLKTDCSARLTQGDRGVIDTRGMYHEVVDYVLCFCKSLQQGTYCTLAVSATVSHQDNRSRRKMRPGPSYTFGVDVYANRWHGEVSPRWPPHANFTLWKVAPNAPPCGEFQDIPHFAEISADGNGGIKCTPQIRHLQRGPH